MKIVRNGLLALAGLIAILVVIGLFLPERVHIERSTIIDAPAGPVYKILSGFERFNEWSPWYPLDPDAEYIVSNPGHGAGASFAWTSDKPGVGSGTQQIIDTEENQLVQIKLDFGPQGKALASYLLEPAGNEKTRVTWAMDTDFGYDLVGRYVGLTFETWVGDDYERGLANLKALVESEQLHSGDAGTESMPEPTATVPPGN